MGLVEVLGNILDQQPSEVFCGGVLSNSARLQSHVDTIYLRGSSALLSSKQIDGQTPPQVAEFLRPRRYFAGGIAGSCCVCDPTSRLPTRRRPLQAPFQVRRHSHKSSLEKRKAEGMTRGERRLTSITKTGSMSHPALQMDRDLGFYDLSPFHTSFITLPYQ